MNDGNEGSDSLLDAAITAIKTKNLESAIERANDWEGWWLRPSGSSFLQKHIPYVAADGSINLRGMHAAQSLYVRPTVLIVTRFNE